MEGPAARDMERDCLTRRAPGWPGARRTAVPFLLQGSWKGQGHCKVDGPLRLPEGWGRWEDCSLVRKEPERPGFPGPSWALQLAPSPPL